MRRELNVAVAGATGLVGRTMLSILESRGFPVGKLALLASSRSAGTQIEFRGRQQRVEPLDDFDFSGYDIGLFSAGASVSAVHAPRAAAAGCVVIDNTSQFRYEDDIPLVVPEVNPQAMAAYRERNIIANPNCSTIQMVLVLKPLDEAAGLERVNVATYQSVSGAGRQAVEQLRAQSERMLATGGGAAAAAPNGSPPPIGFNVVPQIDVFQDNGYTREEMKMIWESRKILGRPELRVNPTAVRVPVFYGHSEAVHIETRRRISAAEVRERLAMAPGVRLFDERRPGGYPTAATHAAGDDAVWVGRIREDLSSERGIDLWIVSDNIRKGAALNSVQIAEILAKNYL